MKNKEEYITKEDAFYVALCYLDPHPSDGIEELLKDEIRDKTPAEVVEKDIIKKVIDEIENEHPYKILGEYNTYSDYHQGWSDACDRILCALLYSEDLEDRL